jgi:putative ABC transport system permease protein
VVRSADRRAIWWRWAWRDLRHHAVQIASIGVVVAIGTGLFAGLSSTARWRTLSTYASFAVLHMHELHVALQLGTFAPAGALAEAARSIGHANDVAALAERLVIDAQVEASSASDPVLVGARIVGATGLASGAEPAPVDTLWVTDGARPAAASDTALLEVKFARYYVLHHNERPATLLELGFISNPAENARLQDPAVRQNLAQHIAVGIAKGHGGRAPVDVPGS